MFQKKFIVFICLILLFQCTTGYAQGSGNTVKFDSTKASPKAKLDILNWLPGLWEGEAFGGKTQEMWAPASGGSMMCVFKLVNKNKVVFYEIVTIVEENESLVVMLKHFHSNLFGWEEKDEVRKFPLVKFTPGKIYFDEFTFESVSKDEMNLYVVISQKDGKNEEVKFSYKRVSSKQ